MPEIRYDLTSESSAVKISSTNCIANSYTKGPTLETLDNKTFDQFTQSR
jgi:hypothetical protein